jgi:hypothetical protein
MNIYSMTDIFIIPIISILGFIFNILSTIVFSLMMKNGQRDDMYKHLLLKSICESLGCFFSVFGAIYYRYDTLANTYIMAIWYIWFQNYIINAFLMASTGFEIAATFHCAISIEKKMKSCEKRVSFWLWVFSILVLSFGFEMFPSFTFTIDKYDYTDKFNRKIYEYFAWSNHLAPKLSDFYLVESIIKDVIFLFILLSLNIFILFKLIQIGKRRKRLNGNNSNNQNSNRAENRKIIMIIVLFLTFLLGHLPRFLYFVIDWFTHIASSRFWNNFTTYGFIFFYLSFSASFFVYFFFNNNFKRLFLKIISFRSFN